MAVWADDAAEHARPTELVPQFEQPRRANRQQLFFGLALMTIGMFNKVVLADGFLAEVAEKVYDSDKLPGALDAWMGTLAFSGQIFCDFAGYSTIAIGVAVTIPRSAVDHGIFVFTPVKMGSDPAAALRRIRTPLLISHLTPLCVFFAFLFSDIPP